MKTQMLYREFGKYYDLIYSMKDYKKEADQITKIIKRYKKTKCNELLDVACGTGSHLKYLKKRFSCTGVDINKPMLDVARENIKGVEFKPANMIDMKLGRQFDAITCLFSSIGYTKTYANLEKTMKNFAGHLKKGGVLIIEPWLTKQQFIDGHIHFDSFQDKRINLARMGTSRKKGDISILEMHYLLGEKGKGIKHFVDKHELGLFSVSRTLQIMKKAGLQAKYIKGGLIRQRGLYIGVKK